MWIFHILLTCRQLDVCTASAFRHFWVMLLWKLTSKSLHGCMFSFLGHTRRSRMSKWSESRSAVSHSLWPHWLYSPYNSPGQDAGVGSLSLLQGTFATQGSSPGPLHCWQILYQLSHKGSPRTLEWVTYPFSSRSSRPRNQTGVARIAGRFFTNWAMSGQYNWRRKQNRLHLKSRTPSWASL